MLLVQLPPVASRLWQVKDGPAAGAEPLFSAVGLDEAGLCAAVLVSGTAAWSGPPPANGSVFSSASLPIPFSHLCFTSNSMSSSTHFRRFSLRAPLSARRSRRLGVPTAQATPCCSSHRARTAAAVCISQRFRHSEWVILGCKLPHQPEKTAGPTPQAGAMAWAWPEARATRGSSGRSILLALDSSPMIWA